MLCMFRRPNLIREPENIFRAGTDNGHIVWLVNVSPSLDITAVVGQAHPTKKKIVIGPHEVMHHPITHHTTQQAAQQQVSYIDGAMVAGGTYYHARVLHHHPRRAADSTLYKSRQLIISISLGDLLHGCTYNLLWRFGFATRRPPPLVEEEPTTTSAAAYLARWDTHSSSSSSSSNGSRANHDNNTWPGPLRRLPRQVMHGAGTSPRTIVTLFFFWSDALLAVCFVFRICFSEASLLRLGYLFFHVLLTTALLSKPHPTEGAEIPVCAGCGNPRCGKACCAVYTPLCAGPCARRLSVRCSFLL